MTEDGKRQGQVVWYNERKGCGFVHLRTLRNCGIHNLTEGQQILLHVSDEGKGPQATEVRLFSQE